MKTKICDCCKKELELSNYKKYSKKTNGEYYHTTCRNCEDNYLKEEN